MKDLKKDFIIFFDKNKTSGKLIDRFNLKTHFYIYFMIMNMRLFSVINEYRYVSASYKNSIIFVTTFMLCT